ncbi:hypothetical protein D3C72_2295530 [compost metagenome]
MVATAATSRPMRPRSRILERATETTTRLAMPLGVPPAAKNRQDSSSTSTSARLNTCTMLRGRGTSAAIRALRIR